MISVIIPVYNESLVIDDTLSRLTAVLETEDEIVVVDGGSQDRTRDIATGYDGVRVISSQKGRAYQMNAGANVARGEFLLFLHADVLISKSAFLELRRQVVRSNVKWGWFSVKLNSSKLIYRVLEKGASLRCKITKTPLGDHGIFVSKGLFYKVGGFPPIPLMEDIELVKKLKNYSKGVEIKTPVLISVRRFEREGVLRTFLRMSILRMLYYVGVSSEKLVKHYANVR